MAKSNCNLVTYRKKHPRCRYCEYQKIIIIPDYVLSAISSTTRCTIKDRVMYTDIEPLKQRIAGWNCKCFKPKGEEDIEI